jgi:hypothetical protein
LASQINASNSGFGGIVSTGDSSGVLQLQTTGTTAVTIDTSQNVGIGSTLSGTPSKLVVAGSSATDFNALILRNGDGTTGSAAVINFEASAGTLGDAASSAAQIKGIRTGGGTSGALALWTSNAGISAERMRIDSSGSLLVGPSSAGTYPYNTINAVNYKRQLTSGTAQAVFTFAKTNTTVSSSFRTSFMGTLYVAFSGRTSGGTTSAYGFTANVNIASTAGGTISMAAGSVTTLNGVSSGLTVSCAVSLTSASATSANLSVTITQTAGTLQDNELTVSLIGANSSTDSTSFFTVTPA